MPGSRPERERPTTDAFCISCGGPDPVADGECAACLRAEIDVVKAPPKRLIVPVCRHCGATQVRETWKEPGSLQELVEQTAVGSLKVPEELEDLRVGLRLIEQAKDAYRVEVEVEGAYKGVPLSGQADVDVRVGGTVCPACSRRHGGYFEAIVQVRREGRDDVTEREAGEVAEIIEQEVRSAGGLAGGQAYLLKAEEMHGGYDYYFGTQNVARAVAKRLVDRFAATTNESSTLQGRRDGRDVYRLTIAVRIPQATPGSIIGLDDEVLEVIRRRGNRLQTRRVRDHAKRMIEEREMDRIDLLEPQVLDVVYSAGGEGQILDPETYKSVEVRLPQGVSMGDQVLAVKYEGTWTVLGRA